MLLEREEQGPRIKMRIPLPQRPAGELEEHVKLQSYVNEKKCYIELFWMGELRSESFDDLSEIRGNFTC